MGETGDIVLHCDMERVLEWTETGGSGRYVVVGLRGSGVNDALGETLESIRWPRWNKLIMAFTLFSSDVVCSVL